MNFQKINIVICTILQTITLHASEPSQITIMEETQMSHSHIDSHSSTISNSSIGPHSNYSMASCQSQELPIRESSIQESLIQESSQATSIAQKLINLQIIKPIQGLTKVLKLFKKKYAPKAYTQAHDNFDTFLRQAYIQTILESIQKHQITHDALQPTTKRQTRRIQILKAQQNTIIDLLTQQRSLVKKNQALPTCLTM